MASTTARPSSPSRLLRLARRRGAQGALTRADAARAGIHTQALSRLVRAGALERVARGRYRLPDAPITEFHSIGVAASAVPRGVICLISALSMHAIGTQLPHEVWIAVDRRARRPTLASLKLRVFRFSGAALTSGIETRRVEGQDVRVYSAAKTIADLFKYRRKIGLDVALEALRDGWQRRRFTMAEIDRYAKICRVDRVMRPYLEALVA